MSRDRAPEAHRILPAGTQVVTRTEIPGAAESAARPRGAVGVIVAAPPDHRGAYRVRFPDGAEISLARDGFTLRRLRYEDDLAAAIPGPDPAELRRYVIYRCIVGSRAFGLDDEGSDVDRRGIYLPPADVHWSLAGVPEQIEDHQTEECYWELRKFLVLALKANPNVLECLYTPLVEEASPLARELLEIRDAFLSRRVYQTYNGYAMSQFKKMAQDLRSRGAVKWKQAMHLIRLLLSGIATLHGHRVMVDVGEHRQRLLAIRRGQVTWEEVDAWRLRLHAEFDAAYAQTGLPEKPDYRAANALLVKARRSMV